GPSGPGRSTLDGSAGATSRPARPGSRPAPAERRPLTLTFGSGASGVCRRRRRPRGSIPRAARPPGKAPGGKKGTKGVVHVTTQRPMRVAVTGAGRQTTEHLYPALLQLQGHGEIELVGVCDVEIERALGLIREY